jgi:two-component system, sensor histidine kinase
MRLAFVPVESPTARPESVDELTALKAQFLASLNHEVRTPLTGILGMTDLLLETVLNEGQREYVATIQECADELLALFTKTLEFSDLSTGRMSLARQELHLAESLRSVVASFGSSAQAKGLSLRCRLAGDLPDTVIGDAPRLQQLLSHLVDNAVKFTQQGRIEVSATGRVQDGRLLLNLSVRDTGIGIPPDRLVAVFDDFRQLESGLSRSYNGLGLGLSLVHKLVSLMGGSVTVESEAGRGSLFTVTVPLDLPANGESAPVHAQVALPELSARNGKSRILFVDDNAVAQRIVRHILSRAGYQVACASSGQTAIEQAALVPFDLILIDLQMPEMDGFATAACIRDLPGHGSTPFIALTANVTDRCRRECAETGMQGFVPKPVLAEQLLEAVSEVLA